MTSPVVTIAWTKTEAVLFGPESRLIRLPWAEDDDQPALILETWRTEFPEIPAAQLLAGGGPGGAGEVERLGVLSAQAGLRLELAPPPGALRGSRTRWKDLRKRLRPRLAAAGLGIAASLLAGGWLWSRARERERLGRLTAAERESEERQAASAELGRRQQVTSAQTRALLAACSVPRQYQAEWLTALAADAPAAVVLDAVKIDGDRCRLSGRIIKGAPGGESAAEALRAAIFPAPAWTTDSPAPAAAGRFALAATVNPGRAAAQPEVSGDAAAGALGRLPDSIALQALLQRLAPAWQIQAQGVEPAPGVELRRYRLSALSREPRAWNEVLQLARRLNESPGVAIEAMTLTAAPGETGALEHAEVEISVRVRRGKAL